jgi:hypothetical protein
VGGEELAVGLRGRELPGGVLDAVLADVEAESARVVRPRAARTVEPAVLVWFITKRARKASSGSPARSSTFPTLRAAPQPAAGWWYSWRE